MGTLWELEKNGLGTWKSQKIQRPHPPSPKDKTLGLSNACSSTSLPWQNFYSYTCLSTFSNNWGGLFMNQLISIGDSWLCFVFVFFSRRSHIVLPFDHFPFTIYIHGSWNIAKQYGIKIEVLLGIPKEQFENLGNRQRTNESPPLDPHNPKGKKLSTFSFLIGCMKFLFSKMFATICDLG